MEKLVALSSSIDMLKGLVKLDVSWCPKLKNLTEEIGDLENLEELDASYTRISQPPSSIVRLNKLKSLSFSGQCLEDGVYFVFPQNISYASNSLSLRALMSWGINIPAHLIPLCDDGMSGITQKLALSNYSECYPEISFLLIPLSDLWDTSKANGRTPNDYGLFTLCFYGEMKHYGLRLFYKVDPELDANYSSSKKHSNIFG
ncbi:hypothetical protein MTR67_025734 [Solanum verrucosum]|uniref:C-JID domain-containing protein n=1 Tax=Solanum verrucosum TaxID=315347 RepID=A0AAF0TU54_SOLVR|nr:hypothetical protein MTR67_025734 [Solanum verrucosum]